MLDLYDHRELVVMFETRSGNFVIDFFYDDAPNHAENMFSLVDSGFYDGMFFHEGQPYNQGNIYDFKEDEFINACEEVIKRVEENRLNEAGLKLQSEFTYENTANQIIQHLESL